MSDTSSSSCIVSCFCAHCTHPKKNTLLWLWCFGIDAHDTYICEKARHTSSAMRTLDENRLTRPSSSPSIVCVWLELQIIINNNSSNKVIISRVSSLYLVGLNAMPKNIVYFRHKLPQWASICMRKYHTDLSTWTSYNVVVDYTFLFAYDIHGYIYSSSWSNRYHRIHNLQDKINHARLSSGSKSRARRRKKAKKFYSRIRIG